MRDDGGEEVADLRVIASKLRGVEVPPGARALDDRRISGAGGAAAFAEGTTACAA
jgi:3-phosphoshikimate 1-carboxyvinyltransferase